jgi:excisionase family DNA binding protein
MQAEDRLLGVEEVAEILNVTKARAYALCRSGTLPVVRLGRQVRIRSTELSKWLDAGGQGLPGGWRRNQDSTDIVSGDTS